jgi:hypothetical protein
MLHGRRADEGVVHRSAGDAERAEPGQQLAGCVATQENSRRKVVSQETGDSAGLLRAGAPSS